MESTNKCYENTVSERVHVPFLNGIINSSNTCYMNATLQCLFNVKPLSNIFVNMNQEDNSEILNKASNVFKIHYENFLYSNQHATFMNKFKYFLCNRISNGTDFQWSEQQDAHEFLVKLLSLFQEDAIRSTRNNLNHFFETSMTLSVQHSVLCSTCHRISRVPADNGFILSLNIDNRYRNINDCLKNYFEDAVLSGDNAYFCDNCNLRSTAKRSKQIINLPEILILQLNLFQWNGNMLLKIHNKMALNFNDLCVKEFLHISLKENNCSYELVGGIYHNGDTTLSGHYTAICKNSSDGNWRLFDDNYVQVVDEAWMSSRSCLADPYVLFYVKKKASDSVMIVVSSSTESFMKDNEIPMVELFSTSSSDSLVYRPTLPSAPYESDVYLSNSSDEETMITIRHIEPTRTNTESNSSITITRLTPKNLISPSPSPSIKRKKNLKIKRSADKLRKSDQRTDIDYRAIEKEKDKDKKQTRRLDQSFRQAEQAKDTVRHQAARNKLETIISAYESGIRDGPNYVCVSCGGLFFLRSVVHFIREGVPKVKDKKLAKEFNYEKLMCVNRPINGYHWVCHTCNKNIRNGCVPNLALNSGLDFPIVDQCIADLNDVEVRICAPRVAFISIRPLGFDRQKGMKGNVVNVPCDLDVVRKQLPANFNECGIIQLRFKRRKNFVHAYIYDIVDPEKIVNALKHLSAKQLFKEMEVVVSNDWFKTHEDPMKFVVDPVDRDDVEEYDNFPEEDAHLNLSVENVHLISDCDEDSDNELDMSTNFCNTQLHDTLLIDNNKVAAKTFFQCEISPAENNIPYAVASDKYAEEGTFLRIFGGNVMNIPGNITIGAKCKSFFRRYDRRCAGDTTYIFYMYKKLMANKLLCAITTYLRKHKISEAITVEQILNGTEVNGILEEHLRNQDLKKFMRTIRTAPEYWNGKKSMLFAMIRQLGTPSLFITLSPAECDWGELIVILADILLHKKITVAEALLFSLEARLDLIRRDPVTTARYFENRIRHLMRYIFNRVNGTFADNPVKDYYWRVEFQTRGSPHIHMIVWLTDVPTFNESDPSNDSNKQCLIFIDKYITAHNSVGNHKLAKSNGEVEKIIGYQRHDHFQNCCPNECYADWEVEDDELPEVDNQEMADQVIRERARLRKKKQRDIGRKKHPYLDRECKYNFPWPILDKTIILLPMAANDIDSTELEKLLDMFQNIKYELRRIALIQKNFIAKNKAFPPVINCSEFMATVKIDLYEDYINAIRSSIEKPTVFLKRSSYDIMINPYNTDIFVRHRANMDIQYVMNSYAVVAYVCSYMMKSNALMSRLLNQASLEIRNKTNMTHRKKLRSLANLFQNCSEISAQECVYTLLAMPVSKCSRDYEFIITFPLKDRYSMVQDKVILESLYKCDPNSTSIYKHSLHDYYANRPDCLDDVCLADFASLFNYLSTTKFKKLNDKTLISAFDWYYDDMNDDDDFDGQSEDNLNTIEGDNDNSNENNDNEKDLSKYMKLHKKLGYVYERRNRRIISYRHYRRKTDAGNYFREQILLFKPWRNEINEVENVDHFKIFQHNQITIARNRIPFQYLDEEADEAIENVALEIEEHNQAINDIDAVQLSDGLNELRKIEHRQVVRGDVEAIDFDPNLDDENQEELENAFGYQGGIENPEFQCIINDPGLNDAQGKKSIERSHHDSFKHMVLSLNRIQHKYLMNALSFLKGIVNTKSPLPFYHFISGPAGTGKSHLIKVIVEAFTGYLIHHDVDDYDNENQVRVLLVGPDDEDENTAVHDCDQVGSFIRVLLTAFTGRAAYNVDGSTLHSSFSLSIDNKDANKPLGEKRLKYLQARYSKLRCLIIDEISMVGLKLFSNIDRRLRQIKERPDLPFGGVSLVVLGDFNQLQPVMDQWIFAKNQIGYNNLSEHTTNPLWDLFTLVELTEIMRQREDKEFSEALNVIGTYGLKGLSRKQVEMFDKRICHPSVIPSEALYLFYLLEYVRNHNKTRIDELDGDVIRSKAIDTFPDNVKKIPDRLKRYMRFIKDNSKQLEAKLPYEILFKIGCRLMLLNNEDLSDGLANSTPGVLKKVHQDKHDNIEILWVKFDEDRVGRKKRDMLNDGYIANDPSINPSWTPIFRTSATLKIDDIVSCRRSQFAVDVAESVSIHKIQGATCHTTAFSLAQPRLTKRLRYVALSRVRKLENLYLYGKVSIISGFPWSNMSTAERQAEAFHEAKLDCSYIELERMRNDKPMVNRFPFLLNTCEDDPKHNLEASFQNFNKFNSFSIFFHNVVNLQHNINYIRNDYGVKSADILLFAECHINPRRETLDLEIDNFVLLSLTGCESVNAAHGLALYVRRSIIKNVEFISDNSDNGFYYQKDKVEISLIKLKIRDEFVYICYLYNHPGTSKSKVFLPEFESFLRKGLQTSNLENINLFVLGDFNINALDTESRFYDKFLHKFNFVNLLLEPTTDRQTCIDWCLTNLMQKKNNVIKFIAYLYESIYSDHKPIWLYIKQNY